MTNYFCVLLLFDYPYDMNCESEANAQIKKQNNHL